MKPKEEYIYISGKFLIIFSICWKALQIISVFIRKPIENLFGGKLVTLSTFDSFTGNYYWICLMFGIFILTFLYYSSDKIHLKIKKDIRGILFNN